MLVRLILAGALLVSAACFRDPPEPVVEATYPPLPPTFERGMNIEPIGGFGGLLDLNELPDALDELVAIGVDHVALIPSFYQPRLGDTEFVWQPDRERIDADTRAAIGLAHERGLSVLLKPHLWLEDTADGSWRGDILPTESEWPRWRRSYRTAVLAYARMAAEEGVAAISIGSELTELTLARPEFWRQLAVDVGDVFGGTITYAANWDREFEQITWWDSVDAIGVDAFWPLSDGAQTPFDPAACLTRIASIRESIHAVSMRVDRPVVLTEIGYKSAEGGAHNPWEWHGEQPADLPLQASIYDCIASGLGPAADAGWLRGAYFWIWYTNPRWGGPGNSDFTPRRKPAQNILQAWFRAPADVAANGGPDAGNQ